MVNFKHKEYLQKSRDRQKAMHKYIESHLTPFVSEERIKVVHSNDLWLQNLTKEDIDHFYNFMRASHKEIGFCTESSSRCIFELSKDEYLKWCYEAFEKPNVILLKHVFEW